MVNKAKQIMAVIQTETVIGIPVNKVDIMKALAEKDVTINKTIESEIEQLLLLAKEADAEEVDVEISPSEIVYKFMITEDKSSRVHELVEKDQNQEVYNILKSASASTNDQLTFTQKRNFDSGTEQQSTSASQDKSANKKKAEISETAGYVVSIIGGVGSVLAGAFALSKVFSD